MKKDQIKEEIKKCGDLQAKLAKTDTRSAIGVLIYEGLKCIELRLLDINETLQKIYQDKE